MTDPAVPIDHAARIAELEQELAANRAQSDARLLHSELKAEAIRAGIVDLECLRFLDHSSLTLNEEGLVPEAPAALARLKRDKPWMFAKPNSSHPALPPSPEQPKPLLAKEMTHKEWRIAREKLVKGT